MRTCRYLHYDVFTDTSLEGNQLAVFPEPAGLSTEEMQAITREMNFSECTFIFPSETPGTDVRMRIFTPGEEWPMAGHPPIGSTFALATGRAGPRASRGARSSSSPRIAPARWAMRRCTAECSPPASALRRIPRREAPAGLWGAICSGMD